MPLCEKRVYNTPDGAVAELADAADLKSAARKSMRVQVPPAPLNLAIYGENRLKNLYIGVYGTHKRSVPYVFKARDAADSTSFYSR
jgi:hypothetical protein